MQLKDYPLDVINYHWAVNVRAPILLLRSALPFLLQSKGEVVDISSPSGTLVRSGQSLYSMTKAALEYLTKFWAGEFARDGVQVNAIAYGPADTPIHEIWATDLKAAYERLAGQVPLGRIATAKKPPRILASCYRTRRHS